jgi:hypothetical protein
MVRIGAERRVASVTDVIATGNRPDAGTPMHSDERKILDVTDLLEATGARNEEVR